MKYTAAVLGLFFSTAVFAQAGYEIKVTLKPFKNQYIYLGHYNGKTMPIIDSVKLDAASTGVFKGPKKLGGGIYLVGYPDRSNKFEMLVGSEQKFAVVADTANIENISFTGSTENSLFKDYQVYMQTNRMAQEALLRKRASSSPADSVRLTAQIDEITQKIKTYQAGIISKDPNGLLATLLKALKEPEVPHNPEAQKRDSLYAYRYVKNHFWDDINFWDDRLSRTPFFENRVDRYFEQLVYPSPDSVIREIDRIMGFASANAEMQKLFLLKFVNRYLNQKFMWEDAVFVHLFEKYFAQKNYDWLTPQGRKMITDRAYSLMANITGTVASDIELPDSAGKAQKLFNLKSPYTVVLIYDPTCGHCKETVPKMDSLYHAKWKRMGVKVYALAKETEGKKADWYEFMQKAGMKDWVNVYYSREAEKARVAANIPSYSQLYDVQSFPTLYLLDSEKRIIAKKINEKQLDEILGHRVKTGNDKRQTAN